MQVQFHSVMVHPGDAIYIPTHVIHQVRSLQEYNVVLNVFYTMTEEGVGTPGADTETVTSDA